MEKLKKLDLQTTAFVLATIFALFVWLSRGVSGGAEIILVVLFMYWIAKNPRAFISEKLIWLFALWLVIMVIVSYFARIEFGSELSDQSDTIRRYAKVFGFVVFAWAMSFYPKRVIWVLAAALLGVLISSLVHAEADFVKQIANGHRLAFGFKNAEHTGVLFGLSLIGLLSFWGRFRGTWAKALWAVLVAMFLVGLVATQTRAAWLGFVIAFAVGLLFLLSHRNKKEIFTILIAVITVFALVWVFYAKEIVQTRVVAEMEIIEKIVKLKADRSIPITSIGNRVHTTIHALEKIKERPIFGWGANTYEILLKKSDLSPVIKQNWHHLHNTYLEIVIRFGLVGLFVYLVAIATIFYRVYVGYKKGIIEADLASFFALALIFYVVVNFFESYLHYRTGVFFVSVIAGAALSFTIFEKKEIR